MGEKGECSGVKPSNDEIWAKLVASDSRYSDVEIRSDEKVICSEISAASSDKHSWCKIVRNSDLCSATVENKSSNTILVDGAEVHNENTVVIKDGSEIILGPAREGFVSYRFDILSSPETSQRQLQICVDVENAKCSICLNIWHDVVTVAPCLHNFCNGCFSEWLRRSQEKRSNVLCPQCRGVVQFVGKNHFLCTIAEDMLRTDSSLRHSDEEVRLLDTYSSVRSNLVSKRIEKEESSQMNAFASLNVDQVRELNDANMQNIKEVLNQILQEKIDQSIAPINALLAGMLNLMQSHFQLHPTVISVNIAPPTSTQVTLPAPSQEKIDQSIAQIEALLATIQNLLQSQFQPHPTVIPFNIAPPVSTQVTPPAPSQATPLVPTPSNIQTPSSHTTTSTTSTHPPP